MCIMTQGGNFVILCACVTCCYKVNSKNFVQIRLNSDHMYPVPLCFFNPSSLKGRWSLWSLWTHKAARPRMQHTLLTMSLAGPSISAEYVKCATRCLMAVSCMLQGVKITKAGSFSPPHTVASSWKSFTITHRVTEK